MTCRDEILDVANFLIRNRGKNEFTPIEIINEMKRRGTKYKESTIRTHITARMCVNAPENHLNKTDDLYRVRRGVYKLIH